MCVHVHVHVHVRVRVRVRARVRARARARVTVCIGMVPVGVSAARRAFSVKEFSCRGASALSSPSPTFLGACGCQLGACGNNGVSERFSFCLFLGACGSNGVGSLSWLLEQRENEIDPFSGGAACFLCCDQLKALVSFWRLIGAAASGFLPPWLAAAAAALEADRRWLDSAVWHCLVTNSHWQ